MNDGEPDELPPPSDDELEVLGLVNECEVLKSSETSFSFSFQFNLG